ncbi:hypothetical protein ACFFX0_05825 [Citricoccus parietis]|uniref:Uncharacterized protein n=1 Tax=Citricoccus parietis TaxID=592307 RepID=A0ABV5FVN0_9MICC
MHPGQPRRVLGPHRAQMCRGAVPQDDIGFPVGRIFGGFRLLTHRITVDNSRPSR